MLKQPQLFIRVGKDKYAIIDKPWPGYDLYAWNETLQRIVLYKRAEQIK